jgi:hypothetical protein
LEITIEPRRSATTLWRRWYLGEIGRTLSRGINFATNYAIPTSDIGPGSTPACLAEFLAAPARFAPYRARALQRLRRCANRGEVLSDDSEAHAGRYSAHADLGESPRVSGRSSVSRRPGLSRQIKFREPTHL